MIACFRHKVDTSTRISNSEFANDLANESILDKRRVTKQISRKILEHNQERFINQSTHRDETSEDDDEVGSFTEEQNEKFKQAFQSKIQKIQKSDRK